MQASWQILQNLATPAPVPTLFDAKLKKGDLAGAINQSLLAGEQAQTIAQKGKKNLQRQRQQVKQQAETTLNKYQLL